MDELRIAAGLQDRVIQVYQGLVYMDFDKALMKKKGHGRYEQMDPRLLPALYIAYQEDLSEVSGKAHNTVRERFNLGDKKVVAAMQYWANLTDQVREALVHGKKEKLGPLLNKNFNKRRTIYRISEGNIRMVETTRAQGASAKFTGSGGAVVGTYKDRKMFNRLKKELGKIGVRIIKPRIVESVSPYP